MLQFQSQKEELQFQTTSKHKAPTTFRVCENHEVSRSLGFALLLKLAAKASGFGWLGMQQESSSGFGCSFYAKFRANSNNPTREGRRRSRWPHSFFLPPVLHTHWVSEEQRRRNPFRHLLQFVSSARTVELAPVMHYYYKAASHTLFFFFFFFFSFCACVRSWCSL
jgi:hypothetical protein